MPLGVAMIFVTERGVEAVGEDKYGVVRVDSKMNHPALSRGNDHLVHNGDWKDHVQWKGKYPSMALSHPLI